MRKDILMKTIENCIKYGEKSVVFEVPMHRDFPLLRRLILEARDKRPRTVTEQRIVYDDIDIMFWSFNTPEQGRRGTKRKIHFIPRLNNNFERLPKVFDMRSEVLLNANNMDSFAREYQCDFTRDSGKRP